MRSGKQHRTGPCRALKAIVKSLASIISEMREPLKDSEQEMTRSDLYF